MPDAPQAEGSAHDAMIEVKEGQAVFTEPDGTKVILDEDAEEGGDDEDISEG